MKLTKNPDFLHYYSKFMGILLFVLRYIVYFLASQYDKLGFLTSKKSWPVPLNSDADAILRRIPYGLHVRKINLQVMVQLFFLIYGCVARV